MKNSFKLIIGFVTALILSIVSLALDWVSVGGFMGASGFDQDATFLLIPFVIVTALSALLLINNKIATIIFSVVGCIGSVLVGIVLIMLVSEMGIFGKVLDIGFYLMVITTIGYLVLSIMSIIYGINLKTQASDINAGKSLNMEQIKENIDLDKIKEKTTEFKNKINKMLESNGDGTPLDKHKKKIVIAGGALILITIVGLIGFNIYDSKYVSSKVIEQNIIGQNVSVGSLNINITKEKLESVKINNKEVLTDYGIKTYEADGVIKIKADKYIAEIPFETTYLFNSNSKEWMLSSQRLDGRSDEVVLEIKEKVSEDIIRASFIDREFEGVVFTKDDIKDIVIESFEEDEYELGTLVIAKCGFTQGGKLISKNFKFEVDVRLTEEGWSIYDIDGIGKSQIVITKNTDGITPEEIKEELSILIKDSSISSVVRAADDNLSLEKVTGKITMENIIEMKDVKVVDGVDYKVLYDITSNVKGKKNKAEFEGIMKIKVYEGGSVEAVLDSNKATFTAPSEDQLKTLMDEKSIGTVKTQSNSWSNHRLTAANVSTFKLGEMIDSKKKPLTKYVYGTLSYSYDDVVKNDDPAYIELTYDMNRDSYYINSILSLSEEGFAAEYNKDVVNN